MLLAPLTLVDVPPLLDYPNHLARAVVLAFGPTDPVLSQMYAPHWAIIPNLGIDLVLPPLLDVFPVHVAGRIVIGMAIMLPILGTVAYSRAVFGTNSFWPFTSALIAYNGTLLLGFLNFMAGIGLALLVAAVWITWRERHPRSIIILTSIAAIALFFCHLTSVGFCLLLIGGHELEWLYQHRRNTSALAVRIAAATPVLAGPLLLYALSPFSPMASDTAWPSLYDKLRELLMPFANYVLPLDIATAAAVVGFLLLCAIAGRCQVTARSAIPLVAMAVLFIASPNALKGTFLFDTRFVIMLGFLLFGAILPHCRAATLFTGLLIVRMAVVGVAWWEHRQDLADLRATIASVPPGARVFLAEVPGGWRNGPISRRLSLDLPVDEHMPALLLIEHRAWWPFLFDNPSQQPIETLPPYRELAERAGVIADAHALPNLRGFDYLLVLFPDGTGLPAPLERSGIAALYRLGGRH